MAGYFADNIFTALIDEQGDIYEASTGRKRQKVGVDGQREQELLNQISEMQERLDQYYNKLVELGVIAVPKSAEEIAQEQAALQTEINRTLLEAIQGLKSEIRGLKGGVSGNCNELGGQASGEDSAGGRKTGKSGKGRDPASAENVTGDNE